MPKPATVNPRLPGVVWVKRPNAQHAKRMSIRRYTCIHGLFILNKGEEEIYIYFCLLFGLLLFLLSTT